MPLTKAVKKAGFIPSIKILSNKHGLRLITGLCHSSLRAADRKLIKEIEDALKRIEDGTFGICELTGKPIKAERLEELPWARYSIDAARMLERQQMARP